MSDTSSDIEGLKTRLEKLESQMAFIQRRLGIPTAGAPREAPRWEASPRVLELARKGDKKQAIRAFIDETGASLKEAKEYVESI